MRLWERTQAVGSSKKVGRGRGWGGPRDAGIPGTAIWVSGALALGPAAPGSPRARGLGGGSWERDSGARGRTARGAGGLGRTRRRLTPRPQRGSGSPSGPPPRGLRRPPHQTKAEPRGPRCGRAPGHRTQPGRRPPFPPPKPRGPGRTGKVVEDGPHRERLAWRPDPLNGCPFPHVCAAAPKERERCWVCHSGTVTPPKRTKAAPPARTQRRAGPRSAPPQPRSHTSSRGGGLCTSGHPGPHLPPKGRCTWDADPCGGHRRGPAPWAEIQGPAPAGSPIPIPGCGCAHEGRLLGSVGQPRGSGCLPVGLRLMPCTQELYRYTQDARPAGQGRPRVPTCRGQSSGWEGQGTARPRPAVSRVALGWASSPRRRFVSKSRGDSRGARPWAPPDSELVPSAAGLRP